MNGITVFRFEISVNNNVVFTGSLGDFGIRCQSKHVSADIWRVLCIVASIQGGDKLAEDTPNKVFWGSNIFAFVLLDDLSKVSIATVFHVEVKVASVFEMVSLKVLDNVGMLEFFENGQFGLELLLFFLGHVLVGDLFATKYL
jgi:hypothetical protein